MFSLKCIETNSEQSDSELNYNTSQLVKLFILLSIHIFLEYGEIQKPAVDSQRDMDVCHCGRF